MPVSMVLFKSRRNRDIEGTRTHTHTHIYTYYSHKTSHTDPLLIAFLLAVLWNYILHALLLLI